ncbi:MAG TPA: Rieske 2Fe-2S domain-containing protein, partial [Planctomycetota bacterium]|nr:Rieske 2Fe-2S domain-containing protein [Planctomycetota bacterium]
MSTTGEVLPQGPGSGRRQFLSSLFLKATGVLSALLSLAPLPGFLRGRAARGAAGGRTDAGPLESIPPGGGRVVLHAGKPALVVRLPQGPRAFRAICTHLGCVVRWDAARGEIRCPCHGARFDPAGHPVSGPARGPLLEIPLEV